MTRTSEPPAGEAKDGPLDRDLPCFRCGYNLRGLSPPGQCPECSTSVGESLRKHADLLAGHPQPLTASDPRWLRGLSWACALVVLAGVWTVVTYSVSSLVGRQTLSAAIRFPMYLLPLVLFALGAWLGGAREPVFASGHRSRVCVALRVSTVAWAVCIAWLIASAPAASGGSMRVLLRANSLVAGVVSWAYFWRFRELAVRLGRPGLRRASLCLAFATLGASLMTLLPEMQGIYVHRHHVHLVTSVPVAGQPMLLALVPYSLLAWPRVDPALAAWAAAALVSAGTLVTADLFRRVLRRTAAAAGTSLPVAPPAPIEAEN